ERLRQPDHADEELLPGRDQQAVRGHRARQGTLAAARALRPRVSQRHADRDRGLPRRLHRHPLHGPAADRSDLLAQRPGPAGLRGRREPRLPGDVRDSLPLHADRAPAEHRDRPHLHGRRSAHRLRAAGRVSLSPLTRRRLASFRASGRGYWSLWIFLALFVLSLGTDDQGRDLLARLVYGFRISVLFGLVLTLASSLVGVAAGAVQGYFGGWTDLLFQRFIEVWSGLPVLYLLIILASIVQPSFWWLLG